jgi:ankyrin repeat protein
MVQFFLDHGADPNALSNYDETLLHLTLSRSPRGTKYSDDWMENDWRIKGLLNIIDLEDHDAYGTAHNQVVEHRITTIDALLSHQKTRVNIQDIEGASALHHIRYERRVCALIVSKLVKKGADICACDLQRRTALHLAVQCGDFSWGFEALQSLLESGANVNATDIDGNTPLAFYLSRLLFDTDDNVCRLLLGKGTDPCSVNQESLTLAHLYANCTHMKLSTLKILMGFRVNISTMDLRGRTLLHHIALNSSLTEDVLMFLLDETTLRTDARDSAGKTPTDYAFEKAEKAKKAKKTRGSGIFDSERWAMALEIFLKYEVETVHRASSSHERSNVGRGKG